MKLQHILSIVLLSKTGLSVSEGADKLDKRGQSLMANLKHLSFDVFPETLKKQRSWIKNLQHGQTRYQKKQVNKLENAVDKAENELEIETGKRVELANQILADKAESDAEFSTFKDNQMEALEKAETKAETELSAETEKREQLENKVVIDEENLEQLKIKISADKAESDAEFLTFRGDQAKALEQAMDKAENKLKIETGKLVSQISADAEKSGAEFSSFQNQMETLENATTKAETDLKSETKKREELEKALENAKTKAETELNAESEKRVVLENKMIVEQENVNQLKEALESAKIKAETELSAETEKREELEKALESAKTKAENDLKSETEKVRVELENKMVIDKQNFDQTLNSLTSKLSALSENFEKLKDTSVKVHDMWFDKTDDHTQANKFLKEYESIGSGNGLIPVSTAIPVQ